MIYRRNDERNKWQVKKHNSLLVKLICMNSLILSISIYLSIYIYIKQKLNYKGTFGILNENYD